MENQSRNFVKSHFCRALACALAEAEGNDKLSRSLSAQSRLRLITMSDEELEELSRLVSHYTDRPVEKVYRGFKNKSGELRQSFPDWGKSLG